VFAEVGDGALSSPETTALSPASDTAAQTDVDESGLAADMEQFASIRSPPPSYPKTPSHAWIEWAAPRPFSAPFSV